MESMLNSRPAGDTSLSSTGTLTAAPARTVTASFTARGTGLEAPGAGKTMIVPTVELRPSDTQ